MTEHCGRPLRYSFRGIIEMIHGQLHDGQDRLPSKKFVLPAHSIFVGGASHVQPLMVAVLAHQAMDAT